MSAEASAMSVKLPSSVQRQVDQVKEIETKLKEQFATQTPSGNQSVTPNEQTPDPVTPVAQPEPTATKVEEKDANYWMHRFKTLEGMAKAEQTRQKTHIANLESQVNELKDVVTQLQAQPRVPEKVDLKRYLSQEEIDAYGPDVLAAAVRAAKGSVMEDTERKFKDELKRQIDPLKNKLIEAETHLVQKAKDQFWDDLDKMYPNWLVVNENPKFLEWLGKKDPLSGAFRQELLNHAQETLDASRVVALFTAFEKESPAPQPVVNKNTQVVPDPVATPTVQTSNDAPFMTRAEIKKYYTDKAMGKYRFRPQEAELMEKKINAAIKAGNVR